MKVPTMSLLINTTTTPKFLTSTLEETIPSKIKNINVAIDMQFNEQVGPAN
jgi:hypothetical protein